MSVSSNDVSANYINNINWTKVKTKRFWYKDEPIVTHFMNAISIAIPESERFMVRSVKSFLPQILKSDLSGKGECFITEENSHSLNHTKFNQDLKRHNYPVNFGLKFTKFGFGFIYTLFSKKTQLAMTVCFEHMTAVIARFGFENELMKENVSEIFDLFIWHALEELGHRSTANDIYKLVGGSYIRRILSMLYVTFFFITGLLVIQFRFIFSDLIARRGIKLKHWWFALKFFFGRKGLITGAFKYYIEIYKYNYVP